MPISVILLKKHIQIDVVVDVNCNKKKVWISYVAAAYHTNAYIFKHNYHYPVLLGQ